MQALAVRATPPESADAEREGDKPWQGVVANTLNLQRNGAVGFIDWLGGKCLKPGASKAAAERSMPALLNCDRVAGFHRFRERNWRSKTFARRFRRRGQ